MSIAPPPPQKTLQDYWDEIQAYLASVKQQAGNTAYSLGLTRQQQQNSPASQWNPNGQQLTPEMMRPWLGDNAVNTMQDVTNWYQNKMIPFWQRLTRRP